MLFDRKKYIRFFDWDPSRDPYLIGWIADMLGGDLAQWPGEASVDHLYDFSFM
jgi:hypothetical protein